MQPTFDDTEEAQGSDEDGEFTVSEVDVGDLDDNDLFDDIEMPDGDNQDENQDDGFGFDGRDDARQSGATTGSSDSKGSTPDLAASINRGAARFAVIGLEEGREKDSLETELRETAEAFRLGHFGAEVAQEYLKADIDEIHPVWGLVAASIAFAVVVVHRRPDGDDIIADAKSALGSITGGDALNNPLESLTDRFGDGPVDTDIGPETPDESDDEDNESG